MIRHFSLCFLLSAFFVSGCKKDDPKIIPPEISNSGVFIINEGNFQWGNASLSFYDPQKDTVISNLFQSINSRPLGDVFQSMQFFNGKGYLVVGNSNKIEVVDTATMQSLGTISGLTSPRYFAGINPQKAYVTDLYSNNVSILDLYSNTISGKIDCHGWTEELMLSNGMAFITNKLSSKIFVINTVTDQLTDSIDVGYGPNSIRKDRDGKLWVLTDGKQGVPPALVRIDPLLLKKEAVFEFSSGDAPFRMNINGTADTLFFLNKGVFKAGIDMKSLPSQPLIASGNRELWGLGVDPKTGVIYVADAVDYVQRGSVIRYSADGTLLNSFKAGIIPNGFFFR